MHVAIRALIARWRHLIGTVRRFAAISSHAAQIQQLGKTFANQYGQIAVSTGTWVFQEVRRSFSRSANDHVMSRQRRQLP